jgi:hypothetical protein
MTKLITRIDLHSLKNETHVEFNDDVDITIVGHNPQTLGIQPLYNKYKGALNSEKTSLDFIAKSAFTEEISRQDHERDMVYRGTVSVVQAAEHHFDPEQRAAARRINIVVERYGNISKKTLDDESAAIDDLIRELRQPALAPDIALIGLDPWLVRLEYENGTFRHLKKERYNETAGKTPVRMKTARTETDKYYLAMISQIETNQLAGIPVNEAFVRELNAVIERFKHILAQEIGERKPKPAPNETED